MIKVLFLNPPFLKKFSRPQRSPAVTKSGTLYFPMWLAYAAGVLMENGFEIDFIDAPADGLSMDTVEERVRKFEPALIVMDTSTPSINNDVSIAKKLKGICPNAFIVLVGTHVSALPEEVVNIDMCIDAVARFEYDYTILNLAKTLNVKGDLKNVMGISYKDGSTIIHNDRRPYLENLDELPFVSKVYKKFLKIENYFNPNALYPMVTITSSRGCPFPCTFCVYPQTLMGRGFRVRSVENVVAEMEYIRENFPQAKAVFFEDDTMTVNKNRCKELAERILQKSVKISWTANARVGLDYETMRIMKKAGCRSFCVGFESGSQKILDNMKKKSKLEEIESFMINARKAGIAVASSFMGGERGGDHHALCAAGAGAKILNPDTVQFYPVMVYPGTEAYAWYKERGLISTSDYKQWITPEGLHNTVISTDSLSSEELVRFCDHARRSFYLRPSYLIYKAKQMLTSPREIRRTFKSARTFLKYLIKGSDLPKKA